MPLYASFWPKVAITCPDECWIWQAGQTGTGYGQVKVPGRGPSKAHRVAYELANGPIPAGHGYHGTVVMHSCDEPLCCNPRHLSLGTQAQNLRDMAEKGRRKGERSPNAKLTEEQALYIKHSNRSARSIALDLGVRPETAQHIRRGTRWGHLK